MFGENNREIAPETRDNKDAIFVSVTQQFCRANRGHNFGAGHGVVHGGVSIVLICV